MKKYKVTLTTEERHQLRDLIAAGKAAALRLTRARILLKADAAQGGPAWPDERIALKEKAGGMDRPANEGGTCGYFGQGVTP